jgi:FkbM family methyltransferase
MIKKIIKKLFNLLGLQLSKLNVVSSPAYQIAKALEVHKVNVVFDVGANIGQFAKELREHGYMGKIISFEPLPKAHIALQKQALGDAGWIVHSRVAVGAFAGDVSINVARNSVSSSILPMLETHASAAPESQYTHSEQVLLITLDSVLEEYTSLSDNLFIKIDTQGYEWAVLDGATKTLNQSKGVLLELSLVPLYDGQKLWLDCIKRLKDIGLSLYSFQTGFTDLKTGQTLQVDGLFFKPQK